MSKKIKYGKVDQENLLRYIHGEMTDEERHSIERELQKDLFATEALEGLSNHRIEQVREDLDKLESRLNKRVKGRQSVMWIRIAASVAILLTIGTVYFTVFTDMLDRTDRMAVETEPIEESRAKSEAKGPQVTLEEAGAEQDELSESRILEKSDEQKPVSAAVVHESQDDQLEPETTVRQEITVAEDAAAKVVEPEDMGLEPSGSGSESIIAEADTIGLMEMEFESEEGNILAAEEPEAELAYDVSAVQSAARSMSIAQPSALKEAPSDARKQASAISDQVKPLAVIISDSIIAQPVSGMDSFREFIADNIRIPAGAPANAEVILSFGVSPSGRPQDFEVMESTGESYSMEAMRLLQEGPDWTEVLKNGLPSEEKIRLRINFIKQ